MVKKIFKSDFAKKTTFLFSGSLFSNILNLVGFIFIAKIYDVDLLGIYYMFIATVTILNIIVSLGYFQSIPLLKNNNEVIKMYNSIIVISFLVLLILSPLIFYFSDFALFIILNTIMTVFYALSEQIFIRDQLIKRLNIIRISLISTNVIFLILSFYIFANDIIKLLIMHSLALFLVNIFIYIYYIRKLGYLKIKYFKLNINILKNYSNFFKFIGPGMMLHTIAYQIPILVAGNFFSPAIAAYYNMAFKLVNAPAALLSGSVAQVFIGKLSIESRNNKNIFKSFNKLALVLVFIAFLFILGVVVALPLFIEYFFEPKWYSSVSMSYSLLPLIFAIIAISPLTNLFQFTNNQKMIFKVHFFSALISLVSFSISIILNDFTLGILIFSIFMFIRYIFILIKLIKMKKEYNEY